VVPHCLPASEVDEEEGDRCHEHGTKHQACGGGTDEDAVIKKGSKTRQGDGQHPIEIGGRSGDDTLLVGEQTEETFASDAINQGENQCQCNAPNEELAHHRLQSRSVVRPDVFARQGFAGVGKPVHNIREEREELHQQGVDRQDDFALCRTGRGEEHGDRH